MFLTPKIDAAGVFLNLKARLVADGDQQRREVYDHSNLTTLTVSTSSFFAVASFAAAKNRTIISLDVEGAFLHAEMYGITVHRILDAVITAIIIDLDPSYKVFVDERGCLTVELLRALYGCLQWAGKWGKKLAATLIRDGTQSI